MPDSSLPAHAAGAAVPPLIEQFADRVARRDLPVEPVPLAFDEASVVQRLMAALRVRLGQHDPRRLRRLAWACMALMEQPEQEAPALQRHLECAASSVSRIMNELLEAGLVVRGQAGRQQPYRFTRAGEDWVLAVVKGEQPG